MTQQDQWKAEYEELGEYGLEAKLRVDGNHLPPDYVRGSYEWLGNLRSEAARLRDEEIRKRESQVLASAQSTAKASWVLAIGTLALAIGTLVIGHEQLDDARESREQQAKQAKELVQVQVGIELNKEFDSLEMRRARRLIATQLLNKTEVTEQRVPDFFEILGMYLRQGRIDEDTVYNDFAGLIEMYWPALKQYVMDGRRDDDSPDEYSNFEWLYKEIIAYESKKTGATLSDVELSPQGIHDSLVDEKNLPK